MHHGDIPLGMKRTQIYLDEDIYMALCSQSKALGISLSESIRQILRENLQKKPADFLAALENVSGMWKDQCGDVDTYIRELRQDRRYDVRQ